METLISKKSSCFQWSIEKILKLAEVLHNFLKTLYISWRLRLSVVTSLTINISCYIFIHFFPIDLCKKVRKGKVKLESNSYIPPFTSSHTWYKFYNLALQLPCNNSKSHCFKKLSKLCLIQISQTWPWNSLLMMGSCWSPNLAATLPPLLYAHATLPMAPINR